MCSAAGAEWARGTRKVPIRKVVAGGHSGDSKPRISSSDFQFGVTAKGLTVLYAAMGLQSLLKDLRQLGIPTGESTRTWQLQICPANSNPPQKWLLSSHKLWRVLKAFWIAYNTRFCVYICVTLSQTDECHTVPVRRRKGTEADCRAGRQSSTGTVC